MLTVKEIQKALFIDFRKQRYLWFSANTKAFGYEADMLAITNKKIVVEFEIKRSKSDFHADFKNKKFKHRLLNDRKYPVNFFYFVCEEKLLEIEDIPEPYGLIWVKEKNTKQILIQPKEKEYVVIIKRKARELHKNKLSDMLLIKALTSMSYKWFEELKK